MADEIENEHMALLGSLEGPGSAYIVNTNTHNSAESYFLDGMFKLLMTHMVMPSWMMIRKPSLVKDC